MSETTSLSLKLNNLYSELRALNPIENAEKINELNVRIASTLTELNKAREKEEESWGKSYSKDDGVFKVNPEIRNPLKNPVDLQNLTSSERESYSSELNSPLTNNEWYNNLQVQALTGKFCPAGGKQLESFLSKTKLPVSFVYLKYPDGENYDFNHFVSLKVQNEGGQTVVEYIDSNGVPMSNADKASLQKVYGQNVQVRYRNYEGKIIDETTALADPIQILRLQYDDCNCGLYSSEVVSLHNRAGSEEEIRKGLLNLKAKTPEDLQQIRTQHAELLAKGLELNIRRSSELLGEQFTSSPSAQEPTSFAAKLQRQTPSISV